MLLVKIEKNPRVWLAFLNGLFEIHEVRIVWAGGDHLDFGTPLTNYEDIIHDTWAGGGFKENVKF